jgi:flagellar motor protein MotB
VTDASLAPPAPGGPVNAATMQSAMAQLALPGVDSRFDGSVVRLDIPADRLFEDGTANLLPGGAATLTQVAGELERVFPGHFIGIEGHLDTEPLQSASWTSPHQLTAARSAAVFDFLTTRTKVHEGQLFLVAHGANHPVVSNATAAGRSRNRRVELVVYPERAAAK